MMKKLTSKGIAGILSAVLIIAGAFLIGTPGSKVLANEQEMDIDKFLTVKWQMSGEYVSNDEETVKNLRIVTTIDADEEETYGNVGFNITFLEQGTEKTVEMDHKVDSVFHRIDAHDGGIKYEYGPKAFHATSEWLATCTITEIPEEYWDNGIVIKPYVTMKGDSTKIWGQHRYLTMQDQTDQVITIPVEGEKDITDIEDNDYATFDSIHKQDGFTHVRLKVSDITSLPSISEYTVKYEGGSETVKYRYLLAGAEDCGNTVTDHSWYTMSEGDNKVIVTPSEMRSFVVLSKTLKNGGSDKDFAGETIYLGADITLDKGTHWNIIGATNLSDEWGKYFAGHFDGNMHTIAGVTVNKTSGRVYGLFGEVKGENAIVENFILSNSSFTIKSSNQTNTYSGCIVGSLNQGTVRNVKCDDTVVLTIGETNDHYNGGLVGRALNGVIENCWFAGRIEGEGQYQGGILGGLYNSGATCSIEQCLFTGNIKLNSYTGGICGDVRSDGETVSTLTIHDTLYVGDMSKGNGSYYKGLFIGNVASSGKVVADNLYGHNTTFAPNVKNIGWADGTGANANRTIDADVTHLARADFNGATGYLNIDLDYYVPEDHEDGTWVIVEGKAPHLKVFGDVAGEQYIDIRNIGGQTDDVRTVWYKSTDDKEETFILYSPADFRGFQKLSETYDFAPSGVQDTVKLGADINLNPSTWIASKTPEEAPNAWTPIKDFAGIFDGDMKTISGIYVKSGESNIGLFKQVTGTVENLILDNSYIENTSTSATTAGTGSIVGNLRGTLDTVKSSAHVVLNGSEYAGGLVGDITSTQSGTMRNCWFAGTLSGKGGHHGSLLGGVHYGSTKGYVEHCLSTGTIDLENNTGGLVGSLWDTTAELTISDTLFAGKFDEETAAIVTNKTFGAVLGNGLNGIINVSNVYVQKGSGIADNKIIGNVSKVPHNEAQKANVTYLTVNQLALSAARNYTDLTICDEADYGNSAVVGVEKFWYISDKYPVLASFAEPVIDYELKVATYNIKYGRKNGATTENEALNALETFINSNDIDVYLLQEVNGQRTLDELQLSGYTVTYHELNFSDVWGSTGVAIISKYNIGDTKYVEIPRGDGAETRGLYQVMIDVNNDSKADTALICAHFDNESSDARTEGVKLLRGMVDEIQSATPNMPIIFGGDLNQAYVNDATTPHIQDICEFLNSTTSGVGGLHTGATPTGVWYQLDYIFTNNLVGHEKAEVQNVYMTDGTTELSDHRPLIATLYIKAQ